jgi:hypothetical protein
MRCRAVAAKLDAYVDGELAERDRRRVAAHLAECESCARRCAELVRQVGVIESLPRVAPSDDLRHRIMAALPVRPAPRPIQPRAWAWRPALAAAVAAAIIAAVLWLGPWRSEERIAKPPPGPGPTVAEETQQPPEAPVVAISPGPEPDVPAPETPKQVRTPVRTTTPEQPATAPTELASVPDVYRMQGAEYEGQGWLGEALAAYEQADAEEEQGSSVDVARVYEKMGYTADAVDRYAELAFAPISLEGSNSNGG